MGDDQMVSISLHGDCWMDIDDRLVHARYLGLVNLK
jgi:hypothetical protein